MVDAICQVPANVVRARHRTKRLNQERETSRNKKREERKARRAQWTADKGEMKYITSAIVAGVDVAVCRVEVVIPRHEDAAVGMLVGRHNNAATVRRSQPRLRRDELGGEERADVSEPAPSVAKIRAVGLPDAPGPLLLDVNQNHPLRTAAGAGGPLVVHGLQVRALLLATRTAYPTSVFDISAICVSPRQHA